MKQDKISSSKNKTQEASRATKNFSITIGDFKIESTDDGFTVSAHAYFMGKDDGGSWEPVEFLTFDEANELASWLRENGAGGE